MSFAASLSASDLDAAFAAIEVVEVPTITEEEFAAQQAEAASLSFGATISLDAYNGLVQAGFIFSHAYLMDAAAFKAQLAHANGQTPQGDFANEAEAAEWMWAQVADEDYCDNYRFGFCADMESAARFERLSAEGCCGRFEALVRVGGRLAWIGCNFGH